MSQDKYGRAFSIVKRKQGNKAKKRFVRQEIAAKQTEPKRPVKAHHHIYHKRERS